MSGPVKVAVVQLNCSDDRNRNEEQADALIAQAVAAGAQFVALPENADQIAPRERRIADAEPLDGLLIGRYQERARKHGIWLLLGSFGERADGGKIRNTSVMFNPSGEIAGVYRKIHLFDADPPDGVPYRESATVDAGSDVVTVDTPFGTVGMSVCYDVRFPELYRAMSRKGESVIAIPSAFTVPTGRAHWELLVRARAVENLSYVIAPAQIGEHGHDRRCYGHSLIVDPWGTVLADAGPSGPGLAQATIDPAEVARVRRMLPALDHRRL